MELKHNATIETFVDAERGEITFRETDILRERYVMHIIRLRDQAVHEALCRLGWTPPAEEGKKPARVYALEDAGHVVWSGSDRGLVDVMYSALRPKYPSLERVSYVITPGSREVLA